MAEATKRGHERAEVYAKDRQEWRAWLVLNHRKAKSVYLVFYKISSGRQTVTYDEAVEESLCFGWIDSKVNSIDEERYKQVFTPWRRGSVWSAPNKERVERMVRSGRMTEAGHSVVEAAKSDGSWSALDAVPEARDVFEGLRKTYKKSIIFWINSAKRPATMERRIDRTVQAARRGEPPTT